MAQTRAEYEQAVTDYIDQEVVNLKGRNSDLSIELSSFIYDVPETIDSTYFLELDDDWRLPIPFGWVALDEHFTGELEQDYYTEFLIEVRYD